MRIDGTKVSMVRGDTEDFTVSCVNEDKSDRPFEDGETVAFAVSFKGGDKVIDKKVTSFVEGKAQIHLAHEDTKDLPITDYLYAVRLTTVQGAKKTIIPHSVFSLEEDVVDD